MKSVTASTPVCPTMLCFVCELFTVRAGFRTREISFHLLIQNVELLSVL